MNGVQGAAAQPPIWLDFPKRVFDNTGAMSSLLKIVQRINDLVVAIWSSSPIAGVAKAFKTFTDIVSARNIFGRTADLSMSRNHSTLWGLSKAASYVGDMALTTGWLAGFNVFGDSTSKMILDTTLNIGSRSITVLKGAVSAACVSGAVLDVADVAQETFREIQSHTFTNPDGTFRAKTMGERVFSVLGDIARISFVFLGVFGGGLLCTAAFGIAAETASLAKFYIHNYWNDGGLPPWMIAVAAQTDRAVAWIHDGFAWHRPVTPGGAPVPVVV